MSCILASYFVAIACFKQPWYWQCGMELCLASTGVNLNDIEEVYELQAGPIGMMGNLIWLSNGQCSQRNHWSLGDVIILIVCSPNICYGLSPWALHVTLLSHEYPRTSLVKAKEPLPSPMLTLHGVIQYVKCILMYLCLTESPFSWAYITNS